jgi:S-adenosylmethionine hydrolase
MAPPVIALLTDFGLQNHYAGTLKGAVLSVCPDATLVDICHEVPPHDVLAGALELGASFKYFPAGTIFLVVVDPDVGSDRRGIAVEAGTYRFVGPDNGVLSVALRELPPGCAVELTERKFARLTISRTFEGRDRFAPVAGWLARGVAVTDLGREAGPLHHLEVPQSTVGRDGIAGEVIHIDRFGNLTTNIERAAVERLTATGTVTIHVGGRRLPSIVSTYSDVPPGDVCALFGSMDYLEIAASRGSAATILDVGRGAVVRVVQGA